MLQPNCQHKIEGKPWSTHQRVLSTVLWGQHNAGASSSTAMLLEQYKCTAPNPGLGWVSILCLAWISLNNTQASTYRAINNSWPDLTAADSLDLIAAEVWGTSVFPPSQSFCDCSGSVHCWAPSLALVLIFHMIIRVMWKNPFSCCRDGAKWHSVWIKTLVCGSRGTATTLLVLLPC